MSPDPKFEAASDAAEGWLSTVESVVHLVRNGNVDMAMTLLMPTEGIRYNLQDSYNEHVETLSRMSDHLAALSDGPVKWEHGRGLSAIARVPRAVYPHVWSSAHEAAVAIARMALEMLARPLAEITELQNADRLLKRRAAALAMSPDEVATLMERIRRERAKALSSPRPSVSLTDSDRHILMVLNANPGKALTDHQIETESVRLNRETPHEIRRLSERIIRDRKPVLLVCEFVAKPPGTQKKGISITDAGQGALAFAAGNPPETRRKN